MGEARTHPTMCQKGHRQRVGREGFSGHPIKPLYRPTAPAIGGRNGHTETSDGIVKADLSVPKEMGGPGRPNTATPEHLFAAGYAACFGGSLDYVAKQNKRDASRARVTCAVPTGPRAGRSFCSALS